MVNIADKGPYVLACALALVAGWLTAKLVRRIPPRGDPRRFIWGQVILYVGTFAIVVVSVVTKWWWAK
jgi:MFS family permease